MSYLKCIVKIEEDDLKYHLQNFMDEETIENLTLEELQEQATQAVQGILSDYFSDFWILDESLYEIGDPFED